LKKEVAELKKDPLHTQVTTLVDEHLDTRFEETREEFMNFFSESLTARIKEQVKDQLPHILPKEVSNFAPPVIEKLIKESRDEVTLAKVSSQPQSTYEAASTLTGGIYPRTSTKHAEYDESNTYVLERFNTTAGNPIKEILLKLNLPDHRLILTDSKEYIKRDMEVPDSS
ncbi:hypothetical protein Tco_0932869, partial [Tanacetum coccineum]